MTFLDIIYTIIIKPLELLFELIFAVSYDMFPNPAACLIIMSLAINLLVLPLYRRADVIQQEARDKENLLRPVMDHIKRTFHGDERVMMLQTFYKQQEYSPLSSMKSIISLLLQIPFFIAAYRFLSQLTLLDGQSMGPIRDLSQSDGLIVIGGITINFLPILMTAINIVSSEIYMKAQPFKSKIVLYVSALIFLVLLYDSPSGLVLYWTMNNVFSLVKNIIASLYGSHKNLHDGKRAKETVVTKSDIFTYFLGDLFITLLTGYLIPSAVVVSSPADFVFIQNMDNPDQYVWSTLLIMIGFFMLWVSVYYMLASQRAKRIIGISVYAFSFVALFNYFVYGSDLGMVSAELVFGIKLTYESSIVVLTSLSMVLMIVLLVLIYRIIPRVIPYVLVVSVIATFIMGSANVVKISMAYSILTQTNTSLDQPNINLSRNGRNVVVIMLDRALGGMIPYIFNEDTDLKDEYDGFIYYPNTISFSDRTNMASPALFGGYEYTPESINSRSEELLKDKHNEALLVMPVIFSEAGYDTTVVDLPYVNYSMIPDTSIFTDYNDINAFIAEDIVNPYIPEMNELLIKTRKRNFPYYSLIMISPPVLHSVIYNDATYNGLTDFTVHTDNGEYHFPQSYNGYSISNGVDPYFLNSYEVLESLPRMTNIVNDTQGCFCMMDNNTTHEPMLLAEPDYVVSEIIDNTAYDSANMGRFEIDGVKMRVDSYIQMSHYHANMAALKSLARWFDYLKENGIWDNTRIIIVGDHGKELDNFDRLIIDDIMLDAEKLNPLLMVKDFNSAGFITSYEFMTNADVPTIALSGVVDDPRNPFSGKEISSDSKEDSYQHVFITDNWSIYENQGTRFNAGSWYSVHDNIFDRSNWEYLGDY